MTSTATEVRIKSEIAARRIAPWVSRLNQTFGAMFADYVKQATKRRRKSKCYRRTCRRMKAVGKW